MINFNKISKTKIDFGMYAVIAIFSLIYFVNSFIYANLGFPNAYAWKDLMIKWTDGELVRRGLLGYIFYLCDSAISLKYFATILFYVFFMVPIIVVYKKISFLKLPLWLFISIIFSPCLFLFNLHETLVYKKDIVVIFGISLAFLLHEKILNSNTLTVRYKLILVFLSFVSIFCLFLLIFEIFIFFIPIILLYIGVNISRYIDFKKTIYYVVFLGITSLVLFAFLVIPNIGDVNTVKKIVLDWSTIYPNLQIYVDALYDYEAEPDPFAFMMMSKERYLGWFYYIWHNTKFYQLLLIYVLQFLPIILVFKFARIKEEYANFKYLNVLAIIAVHFPLLISLVAFDFGRWIVLVFYLTVFYVCFFMKRTDNNLSLDFFNNKCSKFLLLILSIIYILLWVPYHWSPNGTIIDFDWYGIELLIKLYKFFFVFDIL